MVTFPILEALRTMKQLPQRQDSTSEQLRDMIAVANKLGCYDAADLLKIMIEKDF